MILIPNQLTSMAHDAATAGLVFRILSIQLNEYLRYGRNMERGPHLFTNIAQSAATPGPVLPASSSPPVGASRRCVCRGLERTPGAPLAVRLCGSRL